MLHFSKESNKRRSYYEYLVVIRENGPYIIPITHVAFGKRDIRNSVNSTWANVMAMILEDHGGRMNRNDLSSAMEKTAKAANNNHVAAKMRQELKRLPKMFRVESDTVYMAAPAA